MKAERKCDIRDTQQIFPFYSLKNKTYQLRTFCTYIKHTHTEALETMLSLLNELTVVTVQQLPNKCKKILIKGDNFCNKML